MKRISVVLLLIIGLVVVFVNPSKIKNVSLSQVNYAFSQSNKYNEYAYPQNIISAKQLKDLLESEHVKLIALKEGVDYSEYIPNSQIVYLEDVSQTIKGVKGYIASKSQMEKVLSSIGIEHEDTIVLYDHFNNVLSTRMWFILTFYGHDDVKVLDGGINAWVNHDYYVVHKIEKPEPTHYKITEEYPDKLATLDTIKNSINNEDYLFVDCRSIEEYKKVHIPNAINIPYTETLNKDKTFKNYDELKTIFLSKEVSPNEKNIIVYCSQGNRSALTYFVLTKLLGYKNVLLYDGSFAEYSVSGLPIEK